MILDFKEEFSVQLKPLNIEHLFFTRTETLQEEISI